jgi:hypothetical protein
MRAMIANDMDIAARMNDAMPASAPWRIALLWSGAALCVHGMFRHRVAGNGLRAQSDPGGAAWVGLIHDQGVGEVILRPDSMPPPRRSALQRLHAGRRTQIGKAEWWSVPMCTREQS